MRRPLVTGIHIGRHGHLTLTCAGGGTLLVIGGVGFGSLGESHGARRLRCALDGVEVNASVADGGYTSLPTRSLKTFCRPW